MSLIGRLATIGAGVAAAGRPRNALSCRDDGQLPCRRGRIGDDDPQLDGRGRL